MSSKETICAGFSDAGLECEGLYNYLPRQTVAKTI